MRREICCNWSSVAKFVSFRSQQIWNQRNFWRFYNRIFTVFWVKEEKLPAIMMNRNGKRIISDIKHEHNNHRSSADSCHHQVANVYCRKTHHDSSVCKSGHYSCDKTLKCLYTNFEWQISGALVKHVWSYLLSGYSQT